MAERVAAAKKRAAAAVGGGGSKAVRAVPVVEKIGAKRAAKREAATLEAISKKLLTSGALKRISLAAGVLRLGNKKAVAELLLTQRVPALEGDIAAAAALAHNANRKTIGRRDIVAALASRGTYVAGVSR